MLNWQEHKPNPDAVPDRDFVKLNKMSLKNKVIKCHDVYKYRLTHDARKDSGKNFQENKSYPLPSDADKKYTYGMKTRYVLSS